MVFIYSLIHSFIDLSIKPFSLNTKTPARPTHFYLYKVEGGRYGHYYHLASDIQLVSFFSKSLLASMGRKEEVSEYSECSPAIWTVDACVLWLYFSNDMYLQG